MKQALIRFPDIAAMVQFVVDHKLSEAQRDIDNRSLVCVLPDELIVIAETEYGATLLFMSVVE